MKKIAIIEIAAILLLVFCHLNPNIAESKAAEADTSKDSQVCVIYEAVKFVDVEAYEDTLERLAWSLGMVESKMKIDAVNGDCYGPLQIRPIMMMEANRLVGFDMFTLDDLFTWSGSVAILGVIMNAYNPDLDVRKACRIWNRGGGENYYKKVKYYYDKGGER